MKKPSDSIIDSINSGASEFDYYENKKILEEWCLLLSRLSMFDLGYTSTQENIGNERWFVGTDDIGDWDQPEQLSEQLFTFTLNLDPLSESDLQLWIVFEKNNTAYFQDNFTIISNEEIDNPLTKHFMDFLGFKGTWEEVARKTVELNNLAASINKIPPIPDVLRE